MTQNFSDTSKNHVHRAVSVWAEKYLKNKGFKNDYWQVSIKITLTAEEQEHFIKTYTKHNYDDYIRCLNAGLVPPSTSYNNLSVTVPTGLYQQSSATLWLQFPESLPNLFGNDSNMYVFEALYRKFPELREALPERVNEQIDVLASLRAALDDLMACCRTYTRARQLLDQLPTFLRFMPSSIRTEMTVTNIRRRMRSDTQLLKPETVLFFAVMNLIQPMDE